MEMLRSCVDIDTNAIQHALLTHSKHTTVLYDICIYQRPHLNHLCNVRRNVRLRFLRNIEKMAILNGKFKEKKRLTFIILRLTFIILLTECECHNVPTNFVSIFRN